MKISKRKEDDEQHTINCNITNEMVIEILGRVPCQDLLQNLKLTYSQTRIEQMAFHKANCVNGFVCFWSTRHARFHICNSMTMEYVTTPPNPYFSSNRGDHITVPIQNEAHHVSIEEKRGKICLITNELCHNLRCILFKGYIAHNINDLESLNSWKLEFNVTIMTYMANSNCFNLIPYVPSFISLHHRPIREKKYLDTVCGLL
ncbi:hypothetical protein R3W88_027500 [Solanum pinnatisectum]|uniref:Uncharacterized protein n=1 Tax=Solanum pinnatisectum TaxID=50273 RepID=A0AAV9LG62_9SOLN|nr:hypothetical protein R3W88_027500 [Solanum pinnatisectum]